MKLTVESIKALKPDNDRDVFAWDDELRGFGVRVKPSGASAFLIQYRNSNGVSRRLTLGKVGTIAPDQARKLAKLKLAEVLKGGDPAEAKAEARKAMTVKELCAEYLIALDKGQILGKRGLAKKASTIGTDKGRIERHILPLLGQKKVRDLGTPDIARFMRDIAAGKTATDEKTVRHGRAIVRGGDGTGARTVGLLGGILSYAVEQGVIAINPARGVKKPADKRRDVRLSDEQYRVLGKALEEAAAKQAPWQALAAIRLLALTGCRRGEIEALKWSDVDLAGRCLRLSDSKTGKSVRPLGDAAVVVLKGLARTKSPYVLPGRDPETHYTGLRKYWCRLLGKTELKTLLMHGLRHGFASTAADLGMTEITIKGLIGHSSASVTGRYIHAVDTTLIAAADRVTRRIHAAMTGSSAGAEVVELRAAS
jgi:integrase